MAAARVLPATVEGDYHEARGKLERDEARESGSRYEAILVNGMTDDNGYPVADKDFATSQARAVGEAISACWSAEIYIPDLSHRFWRLTLQVSFCASLFSQRLPHRP